MRYRKRSCELLAAHNNENRDKKRLLSIPARTEYKVFSIFVKREEKKCSNSLFSSPCFYRQEMLEEYVKFDSIYCCIFISGLLSKFLIY